VGVIVFVGTGVLVGTAVRVGAGVMVETGTFVAAGSFVGTGVRVSTGSLVSTGTLVGTGVRVGIGACTGLSTAAWGGLAPLVRPEAAAGFTGTTFATTVGVAPPPALITFVVVVPTTGLRAPTGSLFSLPPPQATRPSTIEAASTA
jgi:hypothetical protein